MGSGRKLSAELSEALELVAPGTQLREGIENIIRAGNGGLVVAANPEELEGSLVSGGMELGCEFTAMRLYELAKMDGAILITSDFSTIYHANVQLNPDPDLPSRETGMRHLAAHRTAQQTGALAIAISERRRVVTLYPGERPPRILQGTQAILNKSDSALATLEKYTRRLREEVRLLSIHEHEGTVSLREVVGTLRTFEYTIHITEEIEDYLKELGREGRLISMQLDQSSRWVPRQHEALIRDYVPEGRTYEEAKERLLNLGTEQLSDSIELAKALGYRQEELSEGKLLRPRGYRQLARVSRLPKEVAQRLVEEFGSLESLMEASEEELSEVKGVDEARARTIRRALESLEELGVPERVG
ncbi:MAG: DNA integrity scanning diadenylate cyclase DisA [Actinomycetota bacterium]|nr:DNA integrity scanning diadenylate cyclase DisA [Actinomycetota bacterium]